jgi:glyoxylase-like metal-dependent hydrolase (beta-lactamase superfamily II)
MRIETLDLDFQGMPRVIAAFLIHGPESPVLVETGPASALPALLDRLTERGIEPQDVRDVLVTHIHLDHAGAAGWWASQGARVWVHEVGARHLVDPSKLLGSATRIYGDEMDTLWGEITPAPADRVKPVKDGETLKVGGLSIQAIASPGHAWHHHVYRLEEAAFTGDIAGILLPESRWIDLPAPPPEFDLEVWKGTLEKLRGLGLQTLYRTHFGPTSDVEEELAVLEEILERGASWIREMIEQGLDRDRMIERFSTLMRERAVEQGSTEEDARAYELANPRVMSVDGIARYWRKRLAG